MNTRRITARRLNEEIANAEVPPQGNQVPHLEEFANDDQGPVNPPPLTKGDIRDSLLQMSQSITTPTKAVTTQAQAMTTQDNRILYPKQTNKFLPCPIV